MNKNEFVYASPFSGYAQVALAYSCEAIGVRCTIFAESQNGGMSSTTEGISDIANVRLCRTLKEAELLASQYVEDKPSTQKIPLGFDDIRYRECLQRELSRQWQVLCRGLGFIPKKLWLPVGSGTLSNTFRGVVGDDTTLVCVDVRVLMPDDIRLRRLRELSNVVFMRAELPFSLPAVLPPPIPSNSFYDAKLWPIIERWATPQDVWWNVAK